jgi:hypothetical protein
MRRYDRVITSVCSSAYNNLFWMHSARRGSICSSTLRVLSVLKHSKHSSSNIFQRNNECCELYHTFAHFLLHRFEYGTLTSGEFRDFFCSHFASNSAVESLDWDQLLLSTGMPTHRHPDFSNALSASAIQTSQQIVAFAKKENQANKAKISALDVSVSY